MNVIVFVLLAADMDIDMNIDSYPSSDVYNNFKQFKRMYHSEDENDADAIIVVLSLIFGLNYLYSYSILNEEQYVNKVINSLVFKDKNVMKFFKQINVVLNNYVGRKIGG